MSKKIFSGFNSYMNTIGIYRKIVGNIKNINNTRMIQRESFVTKPDIVDIHSEPKLSKLGKIKKRFNDILTHLNKQTVKELEKCSIDEFFEKSKRLIADSYNIPESLTAEINIFPEINKKAGMMYNFCDNTIYVNPKVLTKPRYQIFSLIKHEYTHQKQNYQILRTEGLGRKAIEEFANIKARAVAEEFVNKFSKISDKELQAMPSQQQMQLYPWIIKLRYAMQQGEEGIRNFKEQVYKNDYPINLENLKNLRQKIIEKLGIIPAKSKDAKKAKEYFKDFMKLYKDPLNIKANIHSINENEAYGAQGLAMWEYILHKFI